MVAGRWRLVRFVTRKDNLITSANESEVSNFINIIFRICSNGSTRTNHIVNISSHISIYMDLQVFIREIRNALVDIFFSALNQINSYCGWSDSANGFNCAAFLIMIYEWGTFEMCCMHTASREFSCQSNESLFFSCSQYSPHNSFSRFSVINQVIFHHGQKYIEWMNECHISHVRNVFSEMKNSSPAKTNQLYFRFDTSFAVWNKPIFTFAPHSIRSDIFIFYLLTFIIPIRYFILWMWMWISTMHALTCSLQQQQQQKKFSTKNVLIIAQCLVLIGCVVVDACGVRCVAVSDHFWLKHNLSSAITRLCRFFVRHVRLTISDVYFFFPFAARQLFELIEFADINFFVARAHRDTFILRDFWQLSQTKRKKKTIRRLNEMMENNNTMLSWC